MKRLLSPLLCSVLLAAPAAANPPALKPAATLRAVADIHAPIGDIDLRAVKLGEAVRLVSQLSGYNVVASSKIADQEVTLYLRRTTLSALISNLCRAAGLWYRLDRSSQTYIIMSEEEFRHDIAVARDDKTRILTLKHSNVVSTANAVKALFGERVKLETPVEETPPIALQPKNQGQLAATTTAASSGGSSSGSRNNGRSDNTTERSTADAANPVPAGSGGRDQLRSLQQREAGGSDAGTPAPLGAPIHLTYNKLHNLLLLRTADEDAIAAIEAMVASMDRPPQQVLLELQIMELTVGDEFKREFGLLNTGSSHGSTSFGNAPDWRRTSNQAIGQPPAPDINDIGNLPVASAGLLWNFINNSWRLRLQLLQQENKVKVLSTPSVISINNQPARLFIGEETVLTTGVKSDTVTNQTQNRSTVTVETERRDVGQTLTLLPRINADGSIALTIDQEISSLIKGGASLPISIGSQLQNWPVDTVATSTSQLTVLAQNGLPLIIGGLKRTTTRRNSDSVPGIAGLPVIGALFRNVDQEDSEKQLVLIVTPYLISANQQAAAEARALADDIRQRQLETPSLLDRRHDTPAPATP